jgi:hypothetical protein
MDLFSILAPLRDQAENRIKQEILGPSNIGKRFLYDSVMPLHLNVTGDSQECNLGFLAGGNVQLHIGLALNPDVTVKGDLASLRDVIFQRSSRLFEEAERGKRIVVIGHSWKGQQAVERIRELLSSNP